MIVIRYSIVLRLESHLHYKPSAHENFFQKNILARNIKTTCGGSNENVCAVIAVLAVLKTAITAKTAEIARYIQRIYLLIFRKKGSRNGFLRTF